MMLRYSVCIWNIVREFRNTASSDTRTSAKQACRDLFRVRKLNLRHLDEIRYRVSRQ